MVNINMIYVGSDHAGVEVKEEVKKSLEKLNLKYVDLGPFGIDSVDYSDYAKKVCENVLENENYYGILICGSGTGMVIAANRFRGIRASLGYDLYSAKMSRIDNNANILTLRAREFDNEKHFNIIKTFFETEFSNLDRHKRRIEKLDKL